jgi:hypothetical protein
MAALSGVYLVGDLVAVSKAARTYVQGSETFQPWNVELMVEEAGGHHIKRIEFDSEARAKDAVKGSEPGKQVSVRVSTRVVALKDRAPWIAYTGALQA